MKNKKTCGWLKTKFGISQNKFTLLLIVLCCSLILKAIFFLSSYVREEITPVMTGTYICGAEHLDPNYIVLTDEGEYYKYKQFDMQATSKYCIGKDNIISLNDYADISIIYVKDEADDKENLYVIESGNVEVYWKKTNTPTFVNVDEK